MKRSGFTIVELIVVLFIMGVLLVLSVVSLRSSQVNARDAERKTDVETIAIHLNTYYDVGSDAPNSRGRYPSTALSSGTITYIDQMLRDIDNKSLTAPGITDPALTFTSATNNIQTTTGVLPQPTINQYVYQPLQADNTLCTTELQECRKFNLYYRLEADNTVYMVTGKNQ